MTIVKKKLNRYSEPQQQIVEEIREPRNSTFTAYPLDRLPPRMINQVSGKPWSVNIYAQLLNSDTPLNHIDLKEGKLAKSYDLIKDVTLKLQSELSPQYDEEQGETVLTGTAITPYKLYLNPGDILIGNVDSGEDVIFAISNVQRLTHRKDTLYEITFSALAWVHDNPEYIANLTPRVHGIYYYDNYLDSINTDVLIDGERKNYIDSLRLLLEDTRQYYFTNFFQREAYTLLIPGYQHPAIDTILQTFVTRTNDMSKVAQGSYYYNPSVYGSGYDRMTILDAIIRRNNPVNPLVYERRCGFFTKELFFKRAVHGSPQYVGIDLFCHPIENRDRVVNDYEKIAGSVSSISVINDLNYNNNIMVEVQGELDKQTVPLLPELFKDDYYIVTENFYKLLNNPSMSDSVSRFEIILARYLKGEVVAEKDIYDILNLWGSWSMLHQYYLLPVMWVLVRSIIGVV